jgi:hypothetical membrane protein
MTTLEFAKKLIDKKHFPIWGIAGTITGLCFILGAQIGYVGTEGEPFSIFNHYVSELGELGVSHLAWMFNLGMILSGLLFIPFMIGLGLYLKSILGKVAGAVGVFSSISIFFVGIYPMNFAMEHAISALSFFFSGMIMTALWAIATVLQKEAEIPKIFALGGVINVAVFALFLYGPWEGYGSWSTRPEFSMVTTLEWGIYFAIIGYLLAMAVYVWNKERRTTISTE